MAEASKLLAALDVLSGRVDQAIQHACPTLVEGSQQSQFGSQRLSEAMRYSLLTPGKRIRPLLFLAAVDCLGNRAGADEDKLAGFAAGIEMIHAYSLIHDDLPAMDDDDLRRGRPTNHKVYGEGMAILAGDALLTEAFERMCRPLTDPAVQLAVIGEVAAAAGAMGMVGGQAADMLAEGVEPEQGVLRSIHRRKTGCLIACSVTAGARMAGADADELRALREFGDRFGLAFQIADDIKDEVLPASVTGKTGGGDTAAAKMTFPSLHGIEGARSLCRSELAAADKALAALDGRGALLGYLASQSVLPALRDDPAQA